MNQPYVPPQRLITLYPPDEWEVFIEEWLHYLSSEGYSHVQKLGGGGDQGRDVVGHTVNQSFQHPWDNYQCKHYAHKLKPGELAEEVIKHIYYSHKSEFLPARKYRFVAPQGVSTESAKLLGDTKKLRERVIKDWNKVADDYAGIENLTPAIQAYIEQFDFNIFGSITTLDVITQHAKTPHHAGRFGHVPMPKLELQKAPEKIAPMESGYLRSILDAYEEMKGRPLSTINDLDEPDRRDVKEHRDEFYNAEYFQSKSRDIHPPTEFISLQEIVYQSVSSTVKAIYLHGVARLNKTLETVVMAQLGKSNKLADELRPIDRKGICHQLADQGRIFWRKKANE